MQATHRASVSQNCEDAAVLQAELHDLYSSEIRVAQRSEKEAQQKASSSSPSFTVISSDAVPESIHDDNFDADEPKSATDETVESKNSNVIDPIRWFGLFVPAPLRKCQRSFTSAIEGPTFDAINAARGMRTVEAEIRRLRKQLRKTERAVKEPTTNS